MKKIIILLTMLFSVNCFAGIAPESPTNTSVIKLTWTAVGDDGNEGTADHYDLRYSEQMITDSTWTTDSQANGEPTPSIAGSLENLTLDNLEDNKTYYIALRVYDDAGNWSTSNVAQVTTRDSMPPNMARGIDRSPS